MYIKCPSVCLAVVCDGTAHAYSRAAYASIRAGCPGEVPSLPPNVGCNVPRFAPHKVLKLIVRRQFDC